MIVCPSCSSPVPDGSRYCPACGHSLSGGQEPADADHTADASDDPSDSGRRARFIPGRLLGGRYRIVERVGTGGMGEVYRADDLTLGEVVALKFLPAGLDRDPDKLKRFFAEVKLARQITHPNVGRVHQIEEVDGVHFLSMEFVDGEDLASLLRRIGRLPADKAGAIAREICAGLAAIHNRGVLHRDLKPANIMIDGRGHARITDFGLAELQGVAADDDLIVGTPAYMSPEALEGRPPDAQSDLYSLGLVLYELFTGQRAFEAKSIDELRRMRRHKTPASPSSLVRDVDAGVERLIMRCLERDPKRRPPSAAAAAATLPARDPLDLAIAAGETPSPQMIADSRESLEGFHPATAWLCLAGCLLGTVALVGLAPRTRVVPAVPLHEPPSVMSVRARDLIERFAPGAKVRDRAQGYHFEEGYVDWIATTDSSSSRWDRIGLPRPPAVTYWYRQSPKALVPARDPRVDYDDPPRLVPGMTSVQLDPLGRLRRLDALPPSEPATVDSADWAALFGAAGLDIAQFRAVPVGLPPATIADLHHAWEGTPADAQGVPLRVEGASFHGRPVYFALREPWGVPDGLTSRQKDPTSRFTAMMIGLVRPLLFVLALVAGAWLARRNLRAGRGDRLRATRVAAALLVTRVMIWVLGTHHTPAAATAQIVQTVALSLYDFAFGWVFYVAIEPYFRRLWPRVLKTWVRMLNGELRDPQVGRDLLLGCLMGVVVSLAVAGHQSAPALLGYVPGRPDNVGFVEHELAALTGILQQLADVLTVQRSAMILAMEFVVILVVARLILRNAALSIAVTFVLFVPFALPKGQWPLFNVAFAAASLGILFYVMMRFGLLAAIVGLLVNSTLQATPLKWEPGGWAQNATIFVLLLVVGVAIYGFVRSLAGRSAIRDVFPERT